MDIYNLTKPELNLLRVILNMKEEEKLEIQGHPGYENIIRIGKEFIDHDLLRDIYGIELEFNGDYTGMKKRPTPIDFLPTALFNSENIYKHEKKIKSPTPTQEYVNLIAAVIYAPEKELEDEPMTIVPTEDIPF